MTKVISIVAQFIVSVVSLVPAGMYMYCCTVFRNYRDDFFNSCTQSGKITDALVVQRIKLAKKRHDHTFFHNINQNNRNPASVQSKALDEIFPPRSEWIKLGRQKRYRLSPIKRNLESLKLTLEKIMKMQVNCRPNWYKKLDTLAQEISLNLQKRNPPQFSAPEILPVPKKKGSELYRPISAFQLKDQLMIGAVSRYIREKIDPVFMECSYAFRAKPKIGKQCPTHHDAVQNLIAFRQRHAGKTLYVAECDIQKFFDILNHRQIHLAFGKIIKELKLVTAHKIDGRAIRHFVNYLECYSYEAEAKTGAQKYFNDRKMRGRLDAPDEKEMGILYPDPKKVRYGVPQGGALSPIIANIVLHWADVAIFQAYGSRPLNDLFYARYCDDMIIVHPDKKVCQELLNTYIQKLREMKLLVHKPKDFTRYDKKFFDVKSKNPYPWNAPHADRSTVPWVSFVGYQIGHEGQIRIRAASIQKEKDKQEQIIIKTIKSIKLKGVVTEKSARQIMYRTQSKLISMAVGKRNISAATCDDMCWANGFRLLKKHPYSSSQIRSLDRSRERLLKWLQAAIKKGQRRRRPWSGPQLHPETTNFIRFFGAPFGYATAFRQTEPYVTSPTATEHTTPLHIAFSLLIEDHEASSVSFPMQQPINFITAS